MRNKKIDPAVAKVMKAIASQPNHEAVEVSVTVGSRVVCSYSLTPKNQGELLRIRGNRPKDTAKATTAFTASIVNDKESRELFADVSVDGHVLTYGLGKFGRDIDYAWLRINNRPVERVFSKEGLASLLKK